MLHPEAFMAQIGMQPTRCQMLAFTKSASLSIRPKQPHPPASPLSSSSCNDFSLVYRPVQAGPRFATPHLFATPCIRTSVDLSLWQAGYVASANFTAEQASAFRKRV
ncbi:uncharacterized protein TrAtP1_010902 [Trichoderma atroviride]|uniref:uncharacterized protein n=1 Tax=Hypocrea atroviridis TaxID=63577 RepID=UPI00332590D0|nr:hypothetical protein TrAtP1_010902 [Trichoderma atroviride]